MQRNLDYFSFLSKNLLKRFSYSTNMKRESKTYNFILTLTSLVKIHHSDPRCSFVCLRVVYFVIKLSWWTDSESTFLIFLFHIRGER